jgi:gluconokinase
VTAAADRGDPRIVVMGVTGAGKSTLGRRLADALGLPFLDADDYHSKAAIASMHAGRPLDDEQRGPWIARINAALREQPGGFVLACSALKRSYRVALREGIPGLTFVYLDVDADRVVERLRARSGHYAGVDLLPSQLATLELGDDVVRVPADGTPGEVASAVLRVLGRAPARDRRDG